MPSCGFSGIIPSTFNDSSPQRYSRFVPFFCALSSLGHARPSYLCVTLPSDPSVLCRPRVNTLLGGYTPVAIRTPPRWDFCGKNPILFSAVLAADQNSSLREKGRAIVDRVARIFIPAIVRIVRGLNTCTKLIYTYSTEYLLDVLVTF